MAPRKTAPKKTEPKAKAEDCAYCAHSHYIVDNENAEPRGHHAMPCPECHCELRAGTA